MLLLIILLDIIFYRLTRFLFWSLLRDLSVIRQKSSRKYLTVPIRCHEFSIKCIVSALLLLLFFCLFLLDTGQNLSVFVCLFVFNSLGFFSLPQKPPYPFCDQLPHQYLQANSSGMILFLVIFYYLSMPDAEISMLSFRGVFLLNTNKINLELLK